MAGGNTNQQWMSGLVNQVQAQAASLTGSNQVPGANAGGTNNTGMSPNAGFLDPHAMLSHAFLNFLHPMVNAASNQTQTPGQPATTSVGSQSQGNPIIDSTNQVNSKLGGMPAGNKGFKPQ